MTFYELVERMADEWKVSKRDAKVDLRRVFDGITDVLTTEDKVVISNFGTFKVALWKKREWKNPNTGEVKTIPEKWFVRFKPARKLLDEVQEEAEDE